MIKKIIILISLLFLFQSCGFKVIDQNSIGIFDIVEIETEGEKRVNHKIRNKLKFISKNDSTEKLKIVIKTKKVKNIKEKNIKNEITKYNLTLNTIIKYELINSKNNGEFTINETGNFNVADKNSQTVNNEKKLLKLLIESTSDKIVNQLNLILDDN